jgi:nucleoside-diphosphate-sugar epimerase
MKVLILGGAGYIGSRVTEYLLTKDIHTEIVDCKWFDSHSNLHISETKFIDDLTSGYIQKFDAIILFAGHSSVAMCNGVIESAIKNNISSVITLLKKLLPHQIFIYSSSSSVYGNTNADVVDETWVNGTPYTEYDLTKKMLDDYMSIQTIHENWWGLRYATVCGGSLNLRTDLMINMMYDTAIKQNKIYIFGGKVNRSILWISDLSKCIYNILSMKKTPGIYNLSSFHSTNYEIAEIVSEFLNVPIEYKSPVGINKTTSPRYNYKINSNKYESSYLPIGCIHGDTIQLKSNVIDVLKDIQLYYPNAIKSVRETPIIHL